MNRASYSNLIELKNYGQASQSDAELGMSQDERSCGTRAFKWVVRHPYLATAAAIGLVGVASGGIYGLTLLGAAAPLTTALSGRSVTLSGAGIPDVTTLSGRNITINSNTTATTTTKAPTVEATTTKAPTTEATTTKAPTTEATTFTAASVTCTGNSQVNPICCNDPHPLFTIQTPSWLSDPDGVVPTDGSLMCTHSNSSQCTNKSHLLAMKRIEYTRRKVILHSSMDSFCQSKGWGSANFTAAAAPVTTALPGRNVTTPTPEVLTSEASTTQAPTSGVLTSEASTTQAPTSEALTSEASTTKAPTTEALTFRPS